MKNLTVKYVLVMYFGRKSNLRSPNKLPRKKLIQGWKKNVVLIILWSALPIYLLYVICCI